MQRLSETWSPQSSVYEARMHKRLLPCRLALCEPCMALHLDWMYCWPHWRRNRSHLWVSLCVVSQQLLQTGDLREMVRANVLFSKTQTCISLWTYGWNWIFLCLKCLLLSHVNMQRFNFSFVSWVHQKCKHCCAAINIGIWKAYHATFTHPEWHKAGVGLLVKF